MFLLLRNIHSCYFLQLSSETWRPWVKQSDQSKPPPRLKMTDVEQTQQSKVYIMLPPFLRPPPKWKNIACWRKVENAIILQTRKNNTATPPVKKVTPPKKSPVRSSPVQSSPESSPAFPCGRQDVLYELDLITSDACISCANITRIYVV